MQAATRPGEPFLHADMDAFFASVEQRDDPSLRGRPVVVGSAGSRGVVAAASYEARRFGIHSAMPMSQARRRCPDLVIVGGHFEVYAEVSKQIMEIFRSVTPLVAPLSLDEAFLDVGGSVRLFGDPVEIAHKIRAMVREECDLPVSVGVGSTMFVAKLLSGKAKPDGVAHWAADTVAARLRPLPIRALWGVGPKTAERLEGWGFRTIGQIADADQRTLTRVAGDAMGSQLHRLAHGIDGRSVGPPSESDGAKSVSADQTFATDIDDPDVLNRRLLLLCERVGARLRKAEQAGRTITLKVRFSSFETITRSHTLGAPTDRTHDLVDVVTDLFDGLRLERAQIRLLGVGVSKLSDGDTARQLAIDFTAATSPEEIPLNRSTDARWEDVERVADAMSARFGSGAVSYAALLDDDDIR